MSWPGWPGEGVPGLFVYTVRPVSAVGHSGELLTWAGVFLSFVWRNFQETRSTAKVTSSAGSPKETTNVVPGST
jgi:hypothetical protein